MDSLSLPLHQRHEHDISNNNSIATKRIRETDNININYYTPPPLGDETDNISHNYYTPPPLADAITEREEKNPPPPPPRHQNNESDDDSSDEEAFDLYYNFEDDGNVEKRRKKLKFYLADRRFHLPGNNACEDFIQFFLNNHPVFGICCHHPLHPIKFHFRILMLLTSIAFGLGATSSVIMWYWNNETADDKLVYIKDINDFAITKKMVAIYLFGSALHSVFDWMMWHTFACTACQPGGPLDRFEACRWIGQHIGALICVVTLGISGGLVWLRATSLEDYFTFQEFAFIAVYLLELVISLFVFSPLLSTILFSGVLGCYRIPVLGGRPFEMRKEARKRLNKQRKQQKQQLQYAKSIKDVNGTRSKQVPIVEVHDDHELVYNGGSNSKQV